MQKLKKTIGNGLPYGLVFFGLILLIGYVFHVELKSSLGIAIIIGTAALCLNGVMYSRFSKPLKDLESIVITLDDSETSVIEAPGNHLIEESLVPGKLLLTNQRLIFKAHEARKLETNEFSWPLPSLGPTQFYSSIWNSGGEFLLKTNNGVSIMFEVDSMKSWRNALELSI